MSNYRAIKYTCRFDTPRFSSISKPTMSLFAMEDYLLIRSNTPGPLFAIFQANPWLDTNCNFHLSKTLNVLGINSRKYKSHSFINRIVALTTLARQGCKIDSKLSDASIWCQLQGYGGIKLHDFIFKRKLMQKYEDKPEILVIHYSANNIEAPWKKL